MLRNTEKYYGSVAKWLHWIVVLILLFQFILGHIMRAGENNPDWFYFYHKSSGATLFFIVLFFLIWRLANPHPKLTRMPRCQEITAALVQWLLYISVLVMGIAGWAMSSWGGRSVPFWGLNLALSVTKNPPLSGLFADIHFIASWVLVGLASLHILAALYHQFVLRDNLIGGMLPQKKRNLFE